LLATFSSIALGTNLNEVEMGLKIPINKTTTEVTFQLIFKEEWSQKNLKKHEFAKEFFVQFN
jgi:hypothetical protein